MPIFLNKTWLSITLFFYITACTNPEDNKIIRNTSNLSPILATENNEGFKTAITPRDFVFPQDHGSHPDFKTEWWYVTGNLETKTQRKFGFQITFFRWGISPDQPQSESQWATNQIYMAHFAITDTKNQQHYAFERFSREALKLAGSQAHPFKVWLLDWSLNSKNEKFFPLELNAKQDNVEIKLNFDSIKPHILQGDNGLSKKNATPGSASYYYSFTRLITDGKITINNETFSITGNSWLDREWSTSAFEKSQLGWDWFSLQLSNNEEIMFYQLRNKNGEIDPASSGSYIDKNGNITKLNQNQVFIKPLTSWKSPSGTEYPSTWNFSIPSKNIKLHIKPRIENQEIDLSVRYWEGAVGIKGNIGSKNVTGSGYVELSGY